MVREPEAEQVGGKREEARIAAALGAREAEKNGAQEGHVQRVHLGENALTPGPAREGVDEGGRGGADGGRARARVGGQLEHEQGEKVDAERAREGRDEVDPEGKAAQGGERREPPQQREQRVAGGVGDAEGGGGHEKVARVLALVHPRDGGGEGERVGEERREGDGEGDAVGDARHGGNVAERRAPGQRRRLPRGRFRAGSGSAG